MCWYAAPKNLSADSVLLIPLAGAQASAALTAFTHRAESMTSQVRKAFVVQLPADVLHVLCHVKYDLGHISALHRGAGAKSLR